MPIIADTTHINPLDQRGVPHYRPAEPLPPICLTHGRPATGTYNGTLRFNRTRAHSLSDRLTAGLAQHPTEPGITYTDSEPDAIVHIAWPTCRRCRIRTKAKEFVFLALVFAAMCTVIGAFGAMQAGRRDIAIAFAFIIGLGTPAILLAITAAFTAATPAPTTARRSPDGMHLQVPGHPRAAENFPWSRGT
ncbi:hypothetical protein ACFYTF_10255 [Nocardia thailandica]|uniref:Uncharacterized protein n=1 Tax=Nocardia thailandica TaxID=257275 RepID=A0ABW6PLD6_9NOCA